MRISGMCKEAARYGSTSSFFGCSLLFLPVHHVIFHSIHVYKRMVDACMTCVHEVALQILSGCLQGVPDQDSEDDLDGFVVDDEEDEEPEWQREIRALTGYDPRRYVVAMSIPPGGALQHERCHCCRKKRLPMANCK